MHSTHITGIVLLIGRGGGLDRSARYGGAPDERQHDKERGELDTPVDHFLGTAPDPACLPPDRRSAGRIRLLDRPVSVRLEKTGFNIVAHSHAMAAGRTGVVGYSFEPTALLFMLVAAMRAWVAEKNIQ